jgi:hypothetical protein
LGGLAAAVFSDATSNAQRFLASAYDTVEDLLTALDVLSRPAELAELLVHATTTSPIGPLIPD